jgi:iron(III) transport system permease protein
MARYMQRAGRVGSGLVDFVTKAPATLSHLIIALAFLVALGGSPFNLQGRLAILVITYIVLYLPFGAVITNAAYAQVGNDLVDSSRVSGASSARTFRKIELPLVGPGLVATWCLCFVLMAGELTASAILTTGGLPVLGTAILSFYNNGNFTLVAALGTIMTVAALIVVGFAQWVSRRFLSLAPPT